MFAQYSEWMEATDDEKALAHALAADVVHQQRHYILDVADALLVAPSGELAGGDLEILLEPVRAAR
jgi:hypothetical protein